MLVVVSDSSPIIYLTRLGLLSLLNKLHDSVIITRAVWQEITVGGRGLPEAEQLQRAATEGWIQVKSSSATSSSLGVKATGLGRGEIEAILIARELGAILLTDDSDGRAVAEHIGIKVSGTLGVLVRAKMEGQVKELKPVLDQLRTATNFRMSDRLYRQALEESGEPQTQN